MLKTIDNNSVILIDPDQEAEVLAELMLKMNAYVSIEAAQIATTLDKTTQYRERLKGHFPNPVSLTRQGRRKAYRIRDLMKWMDDPKSYRDNPKI